MHSHWYLISRVFFEQAKAVATASNCGMADNPSLPLDSGQARNERLLFVINRGDQLIDQPGCNPEKRRLRVIVGALAKTKDALADADTLHFAVRSALKGAALRDALVAIGNVGTVTEAEVEPELKDVSTEGSVLLSAYEIEYFQNYPNFA